MCRNETFGPVVALYRVHSDEEAIRRANDTVYGLNASVVTRDLAAGLRGAPASRRHGQRERGLRRGVGKHTSPDGRDGRLQRLAAGTVTKAC